MTTTSEKKDLALVHDTLVYIEMLLMQLAQSQEKKGFGQRATLIRAVATTLEKLPPEQVLGYRNSGIAYTIESLLGSWSCDEDRH